MSEETSITRVEELTTQISHATETLIDLAGSLDDEELADKVSSLARLTVPEVKGMEGETRIAIPQVYLRQPSSSSSSIPENCKVGHLYSTDGRTLGNELTFVPILTYDIRKKWGEGGIDCMSLDGKTGSKYGDCGACPYGRFEKGAAPDCSPGCTFFAVTEDLAHMFRIDFLKSSAKAGRTIRRLVLPPALWSRSFSLTVEQKSGNNRNYYIYKASPTGNRTSEEHMQIFDALHGYFQALYYQNLERQRQFIARAAAGEGDVAEAVDITVDDNGDDVIDFSDGM